MVVRRINYAFGIVLYFAVVVALSNAADEAQSTQSEAVIDSFSSSSSTSALTASASMSASAVSDGSKQQSKRLAYIGSGSSSSSGGVSGLSSGFKPIVASSYSNVQQQQPHHHQQVQQPQQQIPQPFSTALSSAYPKHSSSQQYSSSSSPYVSTSNVRHSSPYFRGPSAYAYQPQLTYAASQPTPMSYIHNPFQYAQQIYAHQMPSPHHYNHVHHVPAANPFYHTASIGYPQFSYSNPSLLVPQPQQHLHKFPIYNQPQPFTQHHHHVQHPKHHQHLVTSKPAAVETPLPTSSSQSSSSSNAEVHHNQHGAVSYVNYSQLSKLPTPAALIATPAAPHQHQQQQQHAYYHSPQQFYADYKHLHPLTFAQIPTVYAAGASNYFPNHHQQSHHHQHQQQQNYAASAIQPYAQISKISSIPQPSPSTQVLSVSVIPTTYSPQKVTANF